MSRLDKLLKQTKGAKGVRLKLLVGIYLPRENQSCKHLLLLNGA